jgi:hypothetical protein
MRCKLRTRLPCALVPLAETLAAAARCSAEFLRQPCHSRMKAGQRCLLRMLDLLVSLLRESV